MRYQRSEFGVLPNGQRVMLFCLSNGGGMRVRITNFGAIVTSIEVPDRWGHAAEVTAGFPTLQGYLDGHPYFGATVGRFANRIAQGQFQLEGQTYRLATNNGPNHLHGGVVGFHARPWDYAIEQWADRVELHLTLRSPHMEEGYPGNLEVQASYILHAENVLEIEFRAVTDAPTHVNLTNHCYFNLSGFQEGILNHRLWIDAHAYLPVDYTQIPTGALSPCGGTPFDFTRPTLIGQSVEQLPNGIDHCFALSQPRALSSPTARLAHEPSGRCLTVCCTQPGLQVYTSNHLDGSLVGHNGTTYRRHDAICLETQHFPDSPNQPHFPTTRLNPGQEYRHAVRMAFGIMGAGTNQ